MPYIMDATIGENGGAIEATTSFNDLNSSAIKVNGEVNGSYEEPMEVDGDEEVMPIKKITNDINCVEEVDKNEITELDKESPETDDEVGAVPICEVPDGDENVSSNGFGEDYKKENKEQVVSMDDSQDDEVSFVEAEKLDDDDSSQVAPSDPLANNENSLDCNDSNLESNFDNSQSDSIVVLDTTDASDCTPVDPLDPLAVHNGLEEAEDKIENQISNDRNENNSTKEDKSEIVDTSIIEDEKNSSDVQCTDDLTGEKFKSEDDPLDSTLDKGKKSKKIQQPINVTPRRSSRNLNKQKSYIEKEDELKDLEILKSSKRPNDDPDIEEITPVDPLAADPIPDYFRDKENNKLRMSKKTTIVVNDTKRLIEIASGSKQSKMNKKEPTLVLIDTNAILSGRGPIPISSSSSIPGPSRNQGYSVLPVALPAQGMYPQMRTHPQVKTMTIQSPQQPVGGSSSLQIQPQSKPPIILPSLTDDMYVVEAPSFIVPYVYEKPPIKPLKDYVNQIEQAIKDIKEHLEKEKLEQEQKAAETKAEELKQENDILEETKLKEGDEKTVIKEEKVIGDLKMEVEEESKDDKCKSAEVKSENLVETEMKMEIDKDTEMNMEIDKDKEHDNKDERSTDEPKADIDKPDVDSAVIKEVTVDTPKESVDKPNEDIETVKILENKVVENSSTNSSSEEKVKEENESTKSVAVAEEKSDPEKSKKPSHSYFDNPLGKFFIQIGVNLVQEHVQTDLLRSQKRKKDRDGSNCAPEVQMAITSLIRTLEFSKENNEPFRLEQKKCEFCSFKTESMLVMAHHLETPHMRNYVYRCNFCPLEVRSPHDILFHMEAEHNVRGRLERAPAFHQCPSCPFEDNQKGKLTRHLLSCAKKYRPERNQEPPLDFEPPAKIPRISRNRPSMSPGNAVYQAAMSGLKQGASSHPLLPKLVPAASPSIGQTLLNRGRGRPQMINRYISGDMRPTSPLAAQQKAMAAAAQMRPGMLYRPSGSNAQPQVLLPTSYQLTGNQIYQTSGSSQKSAGSSSNSSGGAGAAAKLLQQPSISITPLPRQQATPTPSPTPTHGKPGRPLGSGKATFVICEICDGYIKDLEQLRNHMQWIHKVKIHPKMIYNRPPLNCQKCQFRFFTDQGLERHLLGSHGLVTSSMQEAANKGKDGGRCPVCGRVYQWKLLNHVSRDHNMSLKPAHLSYKCTVCTATFGMYKQFENHVYSAHSVVAKRVMDKKPSASSSQPSTSSSSHQGDSLLKPLKINDEITIIPQPVRSTKPLSKPGPSSRSGPQSSKGKV